MLYIHADQWSSRRRFLVTCSFAALARAFAYMYLPVALCVHTRRERALRMHACISTYICARSGQASDRHARCDGRTPVREKERQREKSVPQDDGRASSRQFLRNRNACPRAFPLFIYEFLAAHAEIPHGTLTDAGCTYICIRALVVTSTRARSLHSHALARSFIFRVGTRRTFVSS